MSEPRTSVRAVSGPRLVMEVPTLLGGSTRVHGTTSRYEMLDRHSRETYQAQ